jgi:hypothetical protein
MTIDYGLACQAKAWVDHMAANDLFEHSTNESRSSPPAGENLAMYYPQFHEATMPEKMWYGERKDYDFATGLHKAELGCAHNFDPNCPMLGHFTQLVWDDSTKLGCAEAEVADSGKYFVVCRYNTPGNFNNAYKQHVHSPNNRDGYVPE